MKDGKDRLQKKCWETAVAAEQICWWEMTKCRWLRHACRKKMEQAGTHRKYQFNIQLGKSASGRKQPKKKKKKPAGRKSLETVLDEF